MNRRTAGGYSNTLRTRLCPTVLVRSEQVVEQDAHHRSHQALEKQTPIEALEPEGFNLAVPEHGMFWFWDKKDTTEPILPWDMTISAQAWQIAMAQNPSRVFAIPPAMTVDIRMIAGYAYFSTIP